MPGIKFDPAASAAELSSNLEKLDRLNPGATLTLKSGEKWTYNGQYWHDGDKPSFYGESVSDETMRPLFRAAVEGGRATVCLGGEAE